MKIEINIKKKKSNFLIFINLLAISNTFCLLNIKNIKYKKIIEKFVVILLNKFGAIVIWAILSFKPIKYKPGKPNRQQKRNSLIKLDIFSL